MNCHQSLIDGWECCDALFKLRRITSNNVVLKQKSLIITTYLHNPLSLECRGFEPQNYIAISMVRTIKLLLGTQLVFLIICRKDYIDYSTIYFCVLIIPLWEKRVEK